MHPAQGGTLKPVLKSAKLANVCYDIRGPILRFPAPALLQSLYAQRIGVETMDTQAACRTYNFLVGEGRRAIAALLIG